MVPTGSSFGGLLRHLRLKAGMTNQQLADELGITRGVISWWETSSLRPSEMYVRKMANAFNLYLPAEERMSEDDLVAAWRDSRRNYDEEIKEMRRMRGLRLKHSNRGRKEVRHEVQSFLEEKYINQIYELIGVAYPSQSQVVRQLLIEALNSKRIIKKMQENS